MCDGLDLTLLFQDLAASIYNPDDWNKSQGDAAPKVGSSDPNFGPQWTSGQEDDLDVKDGDFTPEDTVNGTDSLLYGRGTGSVLVKREPANQKTDKIWHLSQDSLGLWFQDPKPKNPKKKMTRGVWRGKTSESVAGKDFNFYYDSAAGSGQYVYVINEEGYFRDHEVSDTYFGLGR